MWTNLIKHSPAAKLTIERKFCAVFSHRNATRLNRLSCPKPCSIRARRVERLGEEGRPVLLVGLMRDHRGQCRAFGRRRDGLAGIAFVAQRDAWRDVWPYVEQGLEAGCVRNLAAGQIERDDAA